MRTEPHTLALYHATSWARGLIRQGFDVVAAAATASAAFNVPPERVAKLAAAAERACASARADLAAAGQHTQRLNAAKDRRDNQHQEGKHHE